MSPAPQRPRGTLDQFQGVWGYWFGLLFMVAGLIGGIVMAVGAVTGFADDVNELRRVVNGGDLEISLEQGEYLVFDEDGVDIGPFDVRVFRASDDAVVATSQLNDGLTYDVDGRRGRARVAFNVPTADIYRVEVDTSVGQAVRFAVGADVGNARANGLFRGVAFGLVLIVIGFGAAVWTLIMHARWRIRNEVLRRASEARRAAAELADTAGTSETRRSSAERGVNKVRSWTSGQVERARGAVSKTVDAGDPSSWRGAVEGSATQLLDDVAQELQELEADVGAGVADAAASLPAPDDLLARIDEALGRVQERVVAGDSLRDIAYDEREIAAQVGEELKAQGLATTGSLIDQATVLRDSLTRSETADAAPGPPPPPLPVAAAGAPLPPPPPRPLPTAPPHSNREEIHDEPEQEVPGTDVHASEVGEPESAEPQVAELHTVPDPRPTMSLAPPPQFRARPTVRGSGAQPVGKPAGDTVVAAAPAFQTLAPPPSMRPLAGSTSLPVVTDGDHEQPQLPVEASGSGDADEVAIPVSDLEHHAGRRGGLRMAPPPDPSPLRGR